MTHPDPTADTTDPLPTRMKTPPKPPGNSHYGYCYDGSSEWSIGPKDDPQVDSICTVWDRDDDRAIVKVKLIVNSLNSYPLLLAALEKIVEECDCDFMNGSTCNHVNIAQAALAEVHP